MARPMVPKRPNEHANGVPFEAEEVKNMGWLDHLPGLTVVAYITGNGCQKPNL